MPNQISRRDFLHEAAGPFRTAGRLLVPMLLAGAAVVALRSAFKMPLEGWGLLAAFIGVAVLVRAAKWLAAYLYSRLSERLQALCDIVADVFTTLLLLACGVLAWDLARTGDAITAALMVILTCASVAFKSNPLFRRNTAQAPAD